MTRLLPLASAVLLVLGAAACGGDDDSAAPGSAPRTSPTETTAPSPAASTLDPADFVATIDNPYLPLVPGTVFRYRATTEEGPEDEVVTVTHETRTILGITAVVVHDVASHAGKPVEDTYDWYAQDRDGNVWYLGEDTKELEDGKVVSTKGSWEAGRHGARAGVVMRAHPQVGDAYQQEFLKGEAEDQARVLSLTEHATVPYGAFEDVVMTKDFSPLEPDVVEHKYFARGIGSVLEVRVAGGTDLLALVSVERQPSG